MLSEAGCFRELLEMLVWLKARRTVFVKPGCPGFHFPGNVSAIQNKGNKDA